MKIESGWVARQPVPKPTGRPGDGETGRTKTWAAVAFALLSLVVQGIDLWRSDLKPLLEESRANRMVLERMVKQLEDHERRISDLEKRRGAALSNTEAATRRRGEQ